MKKKIILYLVILFATELYAQEINTQEADGIVLMREEEKLARDVYNELYEIWNLNIFRNIAKSEQTHMDRVKTLIEYSNITDPVSIDIPGKFTSPELQKLYDDLIKKGSSSVLDAIIIGLTIEDLDIYDLEHLLEQTDDEEIISVYTNLRDASINHINSFNRQLEKYRGTYTAQFITDDYLKEILR